MMRRRGFTLIEIMVVLASTLLLMGMMVTVFQAGTRTIKSVELKLELYSTARNVLDSIELNIQQAISNEKGQLFCLKSGWWQDNDPFTPDGVNPDGSKLYRQSRREADSISFVRNHLQGYVYNYNALCLSSLSWPGVYGNGAGGCDVWRSTIQHCLQYQNDSQRNGYLSDVGLLQFGMLSDTRQGSDGWAWWDNPGHDYSVNEGSYFLAPGNEPRFENMYVNGAYNSIYVMDLDIAYWDETTRKFANPPDNSAIYFAPMPKALRFTITVCDHNKRGTVTLRRVIWLPVGLAAGGLEATTKDTVLFGTGVPADPSPYNRIKDMSVIEPRFITTGPW